MSLTEKQKLRLRGQADIIVECLPEDIQIEGNASAIDPETDADNEKWIRDELDSGNEWAWCTVKVTLKWKAWEGTDYLGACSYRSMHEFKSQDGYFPDMVSRAFDELVVAIESDLDALSEFLESA